MGRSADGPDPLPTGSIQTGWPCEPVVHGRPGPCRRAPVAPVAPCRAAARPAGPGRPDPLVTTGMIKRAEIRKQLRIQQQLKVGTLALVALLLLAAYPVYLFTRSVAQDPVFGELDSLDLPEWATMLARGRGQRQPVVHRRVPLPRPHLGLGARAGGDQRRLHHRAAPTPAGGRGPRGSARRSDEGAGDLLAARRVRDGHVGPGPDLRRPAAPADRRGRESGAGGDAAGRSDRPSRRPRPCSVPVRW